jgi:hypothetical protein
MEIKNFQTISNLVLFKLYKEEEILIIPYSTELIVGLVMPVHVVLKKLK